MNMYIHALQGLQPVLGISAVDMSTFTNHRPLIEREKTELLRVGQWGANTSPAEWHALVSQIKKDRNNVYPRDWHSLVVSGGLFVANGQSSRDCMTILSIDALFGFAADVNADELEHDNSATAAGGR